MLVCSSPADCAQPLSMGCSRPGDGPRRTFLPRRRQGRGSGCRPGSGHGTGRSCWRSWCRRRRASGFESTGTSPRLACCSSTCPATWSTSGATWDCSTGGAARQLFDQLLAERIGSVKRDGRTVAAPRHVTFKEHFEATKIKLILTGTNLSTGESQLFSERATPHFPVADAVLDLDEPPVHLQAVRARPGHLRGPAAVWHMRRRRPVEQPAVPRVRPAGPQRRGRNTPRTLSLRLGIEAGESVRSFTDLLGRVLYFGFLGSGESQVLEHYQDQMILLDTRGLDLVDFNPPAEKRDRAVKRAARATGVIGAWSRRGTWTPSTTSAPRCCWSRRPPAGRTSRRRRNAQEGVRGLLGGSGRHGASLPACCCWPRLRRTRR